MFIEMFTLESSNSQTQSCPGRGSWDALLRLLDDAAIGSLLVGSAYT